MPETTSASGSPPGTTTTRSCSTLRSSAPRSTSSRGLAGSGAALELGIGTGRIALAARAARRPRARHRSLGGDGRAAQAKPGGEEIGVTIGDFATTVVEGAFSLAYLVFNTIMNLTTQDEQVACFQNVAAHLEPGGCFVIEVAVPGLQRLPPGEIFQPFTVTPTRLGFDEYDIAAQGLVSHHYSVVDGSFTVNSVPFRYVWPAELDLMARIAGLTLRERWSGWLREPFTSESTHARLGLGEARLAESRRAVVADRPVRVVRDLPRVTVRVDEHARVAAPERLARRPGRSGPPPRAPRRSQHPPRRASARSGRA